MSAVVWHYATERPEHRNDASVVLCVKAGDVKVRKVGRERAARKPNGWTQDKARVTCPRCLEWMHA